MFIFIYSNNASNFMLSGNFLVTQTQNFSHLCFWPFPSPRPTNTQWFSSPLPLYSPRAAPGRTGLTVFTWTVLASSWLSPHWVYDASLLTLQIMHTNGGSILPKHISRMPLICSAYCLLKKVHTPCLLCKATEMQSNPTLLHYLHSPHPILYVTGTVHSQVPLDFPEMPKQM